MRGGHVRKMRRGARGEEIGTGRVIRKEKFKEVSGGVLEVRCGGEVS